MMHGPVGIKRCYVCMEVKSLRSFGSDKNTKDRRSNRCLVCENKQKAGDAK